MVYEFGLAISVGIMRHGVDRLVVGCHPYPLEWLGSGIVDYLGDTPIAVDEVADIEYVETELKTIGALAYLD